MWHVRKADWSRSSLLRIVSNGLLDICMSVIDVLLNCIPELLHGVVENLLQLSDVRVDIGLELLSAGLVLGTEVSDGAIKDTLDIVGGLGHLLLGKAALSDLLLSLKLFPVLASSGKPLIDDHWVIAVSNQRIFNGLRDFTLVVR